ncbi:MAG: hypothetical protein IMY72_10035 [Bacteroidetes bacterium]|nr:hypothetical protein [Bacteroidota bacterium]
MQQHNLNIFLNVGNISLDEKLNGYYQDFSPAIVHFSDGSFHFDNYGLPFTEFNGEKVYSIIQIIQYGLICCELLISKIDAEKNKKNIKSCLDWLDNKKEPFKDSYVWRNKTNKQYNIPAGWISGMTQGQAISLFLRGYQLFSNKAYLETANKVFNSFKYEYAEGGFKRIDENSCLWFEEYPSSEPSFVLNGFIYSIFGLLDLYRVTRNDDALKLWESCVYTLETNLPKYDVWYWSVYDQLKKQLLSFYYQKNVHVPQMKIMYLLTKKEIFNKYAIKWEKNWKNSLHKLITKVMYRVKPRISKLRK